MPLSSSTSRVQYVGNASAVTPYVVPFYFLANADVKVVLTDAAGVETTLTETTHYVLTGSGVPAGGNVVTVAAYAATYFLTIYREPQATQLTEFVGTGAFPASVATKALDKLTMLYQSLLRKVERTIRLTDSSDSLVEVAGTNRASTILGFASDKTAKLYSSTELKSLLSLGGSVTGQSTAFWTDNGERALKVPDFIGQIGFQTNEKSLWYSTSLVAGSWTLQAIDEDTMVSNTDRRFPTQQSVKAYVDASGAAPFAVTQRVRGRNTAGAGAAEEVTLSQFLDWIGAAAQGDILYRGASAWERLGAGTSGLCLKTLGAGANPAWSDSGKVAQCLQTNSTADASTTSLIPLDATIPQSSETVAYASLDTSITPKNASSTILVEALLYVSGNALITVTGCIFKDSDASASSAMPITIHASGYGYPLIIRFSESAGSTSARSYKVRWGVNGSTGYLNYNGTAGLYGNALISSMTVREVLP